MEVEAVAMEKIERPTKDLRREARSVRQLLTIRLEDIERPPRK
jgi:hypothetical protein